MTRGGLASWPARRASGLPSPSHPPLTPSLTAPLPAMSSSESEPEPTLPFDGLTFFVHGPQAGRTKNQMRRSIKANGGTVAKSITDAEVKRCLCSAQLWSKQGTAAPDTTIAAILAANQDNRTEDDPDYNVRPRCTSRGREDLPFAPRRTLLTCDSPVPPPQRVWLLPLEWLDQCGEEGCKLDEAEWEFERTAEEKRIARAKELRKGAPLALFCFYPHPPRSH